MADRLRTAYWAVIPAPVRHDPQLRPNAKLLYAEISALCNDRGYCWATNEALAELFDVSGKTVSELISQLEKQGYLAVELIRNEHGQIKQRRIRLRETVQADAPDSPDEPLPIFRGRYPEKSGEECIEKNDYNPPISPQGARVRQMPKWEPDAFARLWEIYPNHKSRQAALRAWDKLKPTQELMGQMAEALRWQMASDLWRRGIGIPYLSTWLNQRRWEDEPDARPGKAGTPETRPREEVPLL